MKDKSFLEILTEKVEQRLRDELFPSGKTDEALVTQPHFSRETTNFTMKNDKSDEIPQWIRQIPLSQIEFQKPKSAVLGRIYPLNKPKPRPTQKPFEPETRQKHTLNERQNQAFAYFLGWKMGLRQDFTESELKRSFRILAQKLHPDRNNGDSFHYIEMKRHYESLRSLFNTSGQVS